MSQWYAGQFDPGVLGKRIRELRTARNWTAVRLSQETGGALTRVKISKLESNLQEHVSLIQGTALARAFGVTVEALLDVTIPPAALVVAVEIAEARQRLDGLMQEQKSQQRMWDWIAGSLGVPNYAGPLYAIDG
jgi:transcriptional regulator with XRE-family HTH domain